MLGAVPMSRTLYEGKFVYVKPTRLLLKARLAVYCVENGLEGLGNVFSRVKIRARSPFREASLMDDRGF